MYPSPGEHRDRPAGLATRQIREHVPARPPPVPGEQREMDGVGLTAATAHPRQPRPEPARLERRERRGRLPDAEQRRPRRVGAGRRRGATAGAEQPGEPQPGCAAQAKPVGAQPRESHRGAPRWLADQMERRDAGTSPIMPSRNADGGLTTMASVDLARGASRRAPRPAVVAALPATARGPAHRPPRSAPRCPRRGPQRSRRWSHLRRRPSPRRCGGPTCCRHRC